MYKATLYHNSRSRELMNIDKVSTCRTLLSTLRRLVEGATGILWSTGHMCPNVEHVQLLDTCRKWSIFDSGYRRHVTDTCSTFGCKIHAERSVHTEGRHVEFYMWNSTCGMSTRGQWGRAGLRQDFAIMIAINTRSTRPRRFAADDARQYPVYTPHSKYDTIRYDAIDDFHWKTDR